MVGSEPDSLPFSNYQMDWIFTVTSPKFGLTATAVNSEPDCAVQSLPTISPDGLSAEACAAHQCAPCGHGSWRAFCASSCSLLIYANNKYVRPISAPGDDTAGLHVLARLAHTVSSSPIRWECREDSPLSLAAPRLHRYNNAEILEPCIDAAETGHNQYTARSVGWPAGANIRLSSSGNGSLCLCPLSTIADSET